MENSQVFDGKSVFKVLLKIAPPIMLSTLIQSLYNIVDSYFVGLYSDAGLAALSVIYPIQLIIIALGVGLGVGVNTLMSHYYALNENIQANKTAGMGILLSFINWIIFSIVMIFLIKPYVSTSANTEETITYAVDYGLIVCIGSLGIFIESILTKIHQAQGHMKLTMIAQISGAITNIILDPILIFGFSFIPAMGIKGAAIATVIGQFVSMFIVIKAYRVPPKLIDFTTYTKKIYHLAYPSILMQAMFSVYIISLNMILATFSEDAVTVLGLYYKIQSFFFIPLTGLQTCIVPFLSYTYAKCNYKKCNKITLESLSITLIFMILGALCFLIIPKQLISIFTKNENVLSIGLIAFRIIGPSFIPASFSLMLPIFFQAIGRTIPSVILTIVRQIVCLIPIFYLFSFIGLNYTWLSFPISETFTAIVGIILYLTEIKKWNIKLFDLKLY